MTRNTRPISWIKAAEKEFLKFPAAVQPSAKRRVKIGEDIWVIHAFQKKSKRGIATPKSEIDVVKSRLKQLKELLK